MNTDSIKILNDKIQPIINKIKNDKKALLIIICGVLGMLLIMFSGGEDSKTTDAEKTDNSAQLNNFAIKEEVKHLIEKIDGAGETEIVITYKSAEETIYAQNVKEETGDGKIKKDSEFIIVEQNDSETGLHIKTVYPEVQGVAVVCEGGNNPVVKEKIYSVLTALFNINSNNISIAAKA